jgi:hypothetical protein
MRIALLHLAAALAVCSGQAQPNLAAQREAMKKLQFLDGTWSGPATIERGPGGALKITQTEHVQFKMEGLVLLIEGSGRDAAGKAVFQALATVSFDDAAGVYHFRAYSDGRYLDVPLRVLPNGFSWGYTAGPVQVENTMRLTDQGEWEETTLTTFGSSPPRKSVEMLLRRAR